MIEFPNMIYLIRQTDGRGPIKIGCSYRPVGRLALIASWSPYPLEIIATFKGSFQVERQIHDCLWRSYSHREWFHPTEEVVAFANAMIAGTPVEQALDLNVKYRTRYASKHPAPSDQRVAS